MSRVTCFVLVFGFVLPGSAEDGGLQNRSAIVASKAYAWLWENQTERDYQVDVVWIYDFLMRKYQLPEPQVITNFRNDTRNGRYNKYGFAPLLHVLSPGAGVQLDPASPHTSKIDKVTFGALWCDRLEPADHFLKQMADLASLGRYELTHVYLSLQILKEKNCPFRIKHAPELAALETKLGEEVRKIADHSRDISDLEVEAAAFYAFANRGKAPSEAFLKRLIAAAEPAFVEKTKPKLRGHTVVLLLWFLLEYLNPQAPRAPLSGTVR